MPYEAYKPDEFFVLVDDSAPTLVQLVTREQTMYWSQRGNRADLAGKLIAAECPRFAERVRAHQGKLSLPGSTRPVPLKSYCTASTHGLATWARK